MDAFMNALIKMSLRGIVIVLIVLLVRIVLKKLQIGHKYILGLWAMVFLYFIFPWKLSLPGGFWNNASIAEEMRVLLELRPAENESYGEIGGTENIVHSVGAADSAMTGVPAAAPKDTAGTVTAIPAVSIGQNIAGVDEVKENGPAKFEAGRVIEWIWLAGFSCFFGHLLYSYFALKRKLRLSILFEDHTCWAENIDMPMVFGLIRPKIYLPVSMESEELSDVIAHEKMHIKRKDGLFKMSAYLVCLIHWFNPFIWIAYFLFGSDLEKACDEEVIRTMSKEERKEYAYALLHIAAGNGLKKKKIFVAPICFGEGNVKSRIRNIMKYKYTLPGIGIAVGIVIVALSVMFLTEKKGGSAEESTKTAGMTEEPAEEPEEESTNENNKENADADAATGGEEEILPVFYVEDRNVLQMEESFSLEDYYITSRYTASNHYYIDENNVLWGTGKNEFGQLGTGTYGVEEYYEDPVRIAENVISVDASWNEYFCIYLTEGGELYGIGLNYAEVLLGEGSESPVYTNINNYQKVTEPILVMTDVAYARAGRECIVVLQNNKSAYWWGQYVATTSTNADYENYWKLEEDASNPVKMFAAEPMKIMEQCKYITTGTFTGAAISESGELYTWGLNVFGQCGTPVTEDDFVRTPVKVMDNVKMVWQGRIIFGDPMIRSSEFGRWESNYEYNTFVLKEDNSLLAVGLNMGNQEKVTQRNGDIAETQTHRYGDDFVPVQVIEYSVNNVNENEPVMIQTFAESDVAVTPVIEEYDFTTAKNMGSMQQIRGMLPGTGEGVWYMVSIDGVEYYYGKYDQKAAEEAEYFEYAVFSSSYSLQNGISVGMTMEEVLEKYPDMAVMNFDGSYLDKEVAGHQGWNPTAYPRSYIGMDEDWDYAGKDYEWSDQFDHIMIADIDLGVEDTLPLYLALMIKDDAVAAITFYCPTAG